MWTPLFLPNLGMPELLVILVIAMIIFGAGKLPQVGKQLGSAINEFKSSVKEKDKEEEAAKKSETPEV